MALEIYRRHTPENAKEPCVVHSLKLSAHEKKYYSDCDCPIWIVGSTDTELYPRQSFETRDWKVAEAKLRALAGESKDETVYGAKLSDCIQRYLDSRTGELGGKAHKAYAVVLGKLRDFAASRNKFFIQDLTVDVIEDFNTYGLTGLKSTSKSIMVSKLRHFLRDAYRRSWIKEPMVEKIKTQKAVYEPKQPYPPEQLPTILECAEKLNGGTSGYATNGHTFRLLLELMLETGMRVSDAVAFNPIKLEKSVHLWIYTFVPKKTKKNDKPKSADVYLTDRLKNEIETCKWFSPSLPFAYRPVAKDDETDYLSQAVYERMQNIGERCGIADCRPHRLRDSFAVRSLLNGIALEDVSKLLCHSSIAVTEKYYAPWVPSRKLRLERLLFESLVNTKGN